MQLRQLTVLRFIAASSVVVFHYGTHAPSLAWAEPLWRYANSAVSLFFFLSGFILTHVYWQRHVSRSDFYVARAARILPLYVLALMAAALFHLKQGTLRWDQLVLNALLVQAWVPGHSQSINSAGWSLSVEACFYLAFPLLLTAIARVREAASLLTLASGTWIVNVLLHVALVNAARADGAITVLDDFSVYHPLTHLATFVAGMCAARLFSLERSGCERWWKPLLCLGLLGVAALPFVPEQTLDYHHNGLFTPVFFSLVLGLAATPAHERLARLLSWRPFEFLGEISYGLYILQIPVAWFFFALLAASGVTLSADQTFALLCMVLVGSASIGYLVVETPLRTFIQRHYRRLRAPAVAPGLVQRRLLDGPHAAARGRLG
jgi:peptidoglycan/LPS O-acetylase OafA/YrhL